VNLIRGPGGILRPRRLSIKKATVVVTASERRAYQAGKQRWEGYLWRTALVVTMLLVGFAVWLRWR
jgi:hypothetical protein